MRILSLLSFVSTLSLVACFEKVEGDDTGAPVGAGTAVMAGPDEYDDEPALPTELAARAAAEASAAWRKALAAQEKGAVAVLFVSDVGEELDAARRAGMQTALAERPGNRAATSVFEHPAVTTFADIVT